MRATRGRCVAIWRIASPRELARSLRVKPGKKTARIATYAGSGLSREEAAALRAMRFRELTEAIERHPDRDKAFRVG